jgi:hypothetical protein
LLFPLDALTAFAVSVDQVCLGHHFKDLGGFILIVLSQDQKEATLGCDGVDPVDMIVDLVMGELSEDLNSPKLGEN